MAEEAEMASRLKELELNYNNDPLYLQPGLAAEERPADLDAALKECMQQINTLREEHGDGRPLHHKHACSSNDSERDSWRRRRRSLEAELKEANEKLKVTARENSRLRTTLLHREELINELELEKLYLESDFNTVIARAESTEKENESTKQECCLLNNKVRDLEAECQHLSLLVQSKDLGQGSPLRHRDNNTATATTTTTTTRRANSTVNNKPPVPRDEHQNHGITSLRDDTISSSRKIDFLVDRLCDVEEENRALRDVIKAKEKEVHSSKLKCARTGYQLALAEAQLKAFAEGRNTKQIPCYDPPLLGDPCCVGSSKICMIGELGHSAKRNVKDKTEHKPCDASKMTLRNHFARDSPDEVQNKLAVVVITDAILETSGNQSSKEIVPVEQQGEINCGGKDRSTRKHGHWPWDALQMILEEHLLSKRTIQQLLDDLQSALAQSCPDISRIDTKRALAKLACTCSSMNGIQSEDRQAGPRKGGEYSLYSSVCKIIEILEGISPSSLFGSLDDANDNRCSSDADCSVHVFHWRSSELIAVLRKFVLACCGLLSGQGGIESFALELKTALEWTVDKCINRRDADHVRENIRRHFGINRARRESEFDVTLKSLGNQNMLTQIIKIQSDQQEVNEGLSLELHTMESANQALERKLSTVKEESDALRNKLQQSNQTIRSLQIQLEELVESRELIEDHMENLKTTNEDLDAQLTVARGKLNETFQKISSMEAELEDKDCCCKELEAVCLELQLQLEIMSRKGSPNPENNESRENLGMGRKMTAISGKLSEHEKTIQALESLDEEALIDEVSAHTADKGNRLNQRFTLRDQMIAEADGAQTKAIIIKLGDVDKPQVKHYTGTSFQMNQSPNLEKDTKVGVLAVVPSTNPEGAFGFIRKLFLRKRKCLTKKTSVLSHRQ